MKLGTTNILVGSVVVLILASMSLFVVDQRQTAIVFQLSEVIRMETTPGLKFKLPLIQNVRFFDSRILTLDVDDRAKRRPGVPVADQKLGGEAGAHPADGDEGRHRPGGGPGTA